MTLALHESRPRGPIVKAARSSNGHPYVLVHGATGGLVVVNMDDVTSLRAQLAQWDATVNGSKADG